MNDLVFYEAPIHSLSGYGMHSREIADYLIELFSDNLYIIETHWGCNPCILSIENSKYLKYIKKSITNDQKIELFIQVALPSEFKKVGKVNIGITALTETTLCSEEYIHGCNEMDSVILPSNFSKQVLISSANKLGIKLRCKVCVINQTMSVDESSAEIDLTDIKNDFCFLFNGQWNTEVNYKKDRKNVETLIRCFISAFYDKKENQH